MLKQKSITLITNTLILSQSKTINLVKKEGKKVGLALKELEKQWIKSNYRLLDKDASTIIDKFRA